MGWIPLVNTRIVDLVLKLLLVSIGYMLTCHVSLAETLPNPTQELLRQQQRENDFRQEFEPSPDVFIPQKSPLSQTEDALPLNESPCFALSQIILDGEQADSFQFALKPAISGDDSVLGLCLGVNGINTVISRIQNTIIAKGYITSRLLVSPQDLSTGTLNITVIPGRIHTIRMADDADSRGRYWNALPARAGDLLNLRDIEQGLENLKRVPTAEADIQIEPSSEKNARPGDSDIVIRYQQKTPFRLTLSADDGGSESTGKYQGSLTLSADNLLTLNDLFYFSYNHDLGGGISGSRGTQGNTIHYSLPFGYWQLGITASENEYHQSVSGASQTFIYSGESKNARVKLSRVVYRDATRKTSISLLGYLQSSHNFIDDTEIGVQQRRTAGWEAGVSHQEHINNTRFDLDLNFHRGTGMFNALEAPEEAFNEGTSRPEIITAEIQGAHPFKIGSQQFHFTSQLRSQWNRTRLIPQDRFSIGGRYTIRGFTGENTLISERGWLIRNDLSLLLGESGQQLYLGVDYGHVSGPSSKLLIGNHLAGAVLGIRGGYKGLNWDAFAGTPLSRPKGFRADSTILGFNLSWTY